MVFDPVRALHVATFGRIAITVADFGGFDKFYRQNLIIFITKFDHV